MPPPTPHPFNSHGSFYRVGGNRILYTSSLKIKETHKTSFLKRFIKFLMHKK
jgi:hypothetical protein